MLNVEKEIAKMMKQYTNDVMEELEEVKEDVAKQTVKEIRSSLNQTTAPHHLNLTGDYAKGWAKKKDGTARVVHNRTDWQLTHLLEEGHARRGGGPRVPGYPHISVVDEKMSQIYFEKAKKVVEKR